MGNQLGKRFWTYSLVGTDIDITTDFGITDLSIELISGTGRIVGSMTCNGFPSQSIDLTIGDPVLISTDNLSLIDGLSITTSGTINLIGR
jgi:hypothetical protein